jgi:predicted DCC family thiol-disulfide oxidoreductase YuxK
MRQFDHFVAALQGRLFDESAVIVAVIAALLLMRWIWKLVYFAL